MQRAIPVGRSGIRYNPRGVFYADRQRNNCLRLTYSRNTPTDVQEGLASLVELLYEEGY